MVIFLLIGRTMRTLPLLFASALVVTGCSPDKPVSGNVQGRVTFQSQPVTEGTVIFENPTAAWINVAELDSGGRYELPDIRVAEYHVSIQPPQPVVPNENTHTPEELRALRGSVKPPDPKNIPKSVRSTQTTRLRANVVEGNNTYDFELANTIGS